MPFLPSFAVPSTQRAIKIEGPRKAAVVQDAPVPTVRENEVLIRVVCVALNPVDWKSADLSPSVGATWGIDFSGEVVAVGATVEPSQFPIGQAVCGAAFGNNPDDHSQGAFADYVAIPADLLLTIPKGMSFEQAATIGTGVATAGLALYQTLQLPWPSMKAKTSESSQYVLVQGAGTATGSILIQMIRLSGLIPIATCSPKSIDRVTKLGAATAFDYNSPSCGADIREYTQDSLAYAVDCISTADSMKICYDAIGAAGGKYVALDPFPIRSHTRRVIKPNWIIGFTIYGCPVNWKRPYNRDARPRDRDFGKKFFAFVQGLLEEGRLETHPRRDEAGGLEGVIHGAEMGRKGEINGVKLVYRVN